MGRGNQNSGLLLEQPTRSQQETDFPFQNEKITSVEQLSNWPTVSLDSQYKFYLDYHLFPQELFESCHHQALQPDFWIDKLNDFQASGFTVRLPEKNNNQDNPYRNTGLACLMINADVIDQKSQSAIGEMNLSVSVGPDGNPELRIAGVSLRQPSFKYQITQEQQENPDYYLGRGFAQQLVNHLKTVCQENKIPRISLHAVGVGAYAWAKDDFQLDPRVHYDQRIDQDYQSCKQEFNNSLKERFQRTILTNYPEDQHQKMIDDLQSADLNSLKEFAEYGKQDAKPGNDWLGKQAMTDSCWHGVFLVDLNQG
jgi:hypothetical protein